MGGLILEIVEGAGAGTQVALAGPVQVGRSSDAQITLDDLEASRQHLRVEPAGSATAVVMDLSSTNGTFVNDQPIYGRRQVQPGDRIRAGMTVIELRTTEQVRAQPSAAIPVPSMATVGGDMLRPVPRDQLPSQELPSFAPPGAAPPPAAGPDQGDPGYAAVAALVDSRVKRQTNVAVFALLSAAGLAVLIFFGVR
jgi:pSer/pThr/pTyr-binding forkhead associated (FHA) protein